MIYVHETLCITCLWNTMYVCITYYIDVCEYFRILNVYDTKYIFVHIDVAWYVGGYLYILFQFCFLSYTRPVPWDVLRASDWLYHAASQRPLTSGVVHTLSTERKSPARCPRCNSLAVWLAFGNWCANYRIWITLKFFYKICSFFLSSLPYPDSKGECVTVLLFTQKIIVPFRFWVSVGNFGGHTLEDVVDDLNKSAAFIQSRVTSAEIHAGVGNSLPVRWQIWKSG